MINVYIIFITVLHMFLRIFFLTIFVLQMMFQSSFYAFATSETVFTDPTFWDISATALQSWGVLDSYPIAGDSINSPDRYCIERGMYLAYYTVAEPSPFGTKAYYNTSSQQWETTSSTTKSLADVTCSALPIVWLTNSTFQYVNNYWDTNFPWFASGSLTSTHIIAQVDPTLNMEISAEEIDLWVLVPGSTATGSLFIEIGTNAIAWVSITARSQNAGLENAADSGVDINNLLSDGVEESYTWESSTSATDSSSGLFVATDLTVVEINDDITEYAIYTTNKPEPTNLVDDVEFIVSTTTTAETPAGDYEDFVTFTVTWNF